MLYSFVLLVVGCMAKLVYRRVVSKEITGGDRGPRFVGDMELLTYRRHITLN